MTNYSLLTRPQYFTELAACAALAKRGERVMVATMNFDITKAPVRAVVEALTLAAKRGAQVTLLVDAINFLMDRHGIPGPLLVRRSLAKMPGNYGLAYEALEGLRAAGGTYRITNIPARRLQLPVMGRSHIKGAVFGNRVFIGGCNLNQPEQIDVMVSWSDKLSADTLSEWFTRIAASGQVREAFGDVDVETELGAQTRLLLDAGVPNQSLIYDEALRLIDDAKEQIYITCQYFPGGATAEHLAAAQARGVHIEIDYSHPRSHGSAATLQRLHQLSQRARLLPRNFFSGRLGKQVPKLHAKVLASEHEALVGSHNYIRQGVQFGTAEIALHTFDVALVRQLVACIQSQLSTIQIPSRTAPTDTIRN